MTSTQFLKNGKKLDLQPNANGVIVFSLNKGETLEIK